MDAVGAHDFAESLRLVERARALTEDPDLIDRLDVTASYGEAEAGDHARALALCTRVLTRDGASALARGLAQSQLALLLMRNGETAEASEHFEAARLRLAEEPEHLGTVHLNRGNLYLKLGDANRAAEDFTAAGEQFDLAGLPIDRAKAVFNLAYTQLLRNDLVAAIRGMDEAGLVLNDLSPISRAIGEQDRAEVLLASGRTQEAAVALEAAAAAYGAEKLPRFQAECELILARAVLTDDPARSRDLAAHAARLYAAHGSPALVAQARATGVVAQIQAGTTARAVLTRADRLTADLRRSGLRPDADRLALHAARLVVRRGDLPDARARLAKVRLTADSPITTRLLAREVRAELAAAQEHAGRVREHARAGLADLHAWQSTFGSLDLQTSTVGHGQHLARLGLRAALREGDPAVVFEWSERARALASRVSSLRPPPDPDLAADLTALRVADPDDLATRRKLRERIRAHSWVAATGAVGEPATLDQLRAALARDDAALVAHIVLDGSLTALAVTAQEVRVVPLGAAAPVRTLLDRVAADLDFAAQNRTGGLATAVRTSLRADLALLAETLVRPLLSVVGYRRLVLTPSTLLAGTPWTELPGLIGRPVTVPTSATHWLDLTDTPAPPVREVGLVAGPRLARAAEEVQRANAAWPQAQVLHGDESDSPRAGWLAARVDLLHIAAHGYHVGEHPLFSALELADGPWFGHDIDLLPRTPATVVLSACDLGRFSTPHHEEALGMSAVWLHAGARTVLSSLALVADDLACDVFSGWHHLVAAGTAPADALAQVSASAEDVVPFVCFGAGW